MAEHAATTIPPGLEELVTSLGTEGAHRRPRLGSSPVLNAVCGAGTSHVYADTADVDELGSLLETGDGSILAEIDGNTANQPLVRKVLARYLDAGDAPAWARRLRERGVGDAEVVPMIYVLLLARLAGDIVAAYAGERSWEVSLQVPMGLTGDAEAMRRVGELLRRACPSAFVKVPFTPHEPHCLLVARDLEREGIPVNFTSTFSARQAVAAAVLADVTRTNVFMGRLDQGMQAELLGEHVCLEAQRALRALRRDRGLKTQLIVASMREWRSFPRLAGCDVFTAPCATIRELLEQQEIDAGEIASRLETSYEDRLGISATVLERLGLDRIARLWRVEPELVEFLVDLRESSEYARMSDGGALYRRFAEAGFGDVFHAPDDTDWKALRAGKLPDLDGELIGRVPLDTLYTLHAHADFENNQDLIDEEIRARLAS